MKKDYTVLITVLATLFVLISCILTWVLFKDDPQRGTFGDMFGSINALFSGLAFIGIIITILLQSKELSLQREELKHTRLEMSRSADAQERAEKALSKQADMLVSSAKLTALNSLVTAYTELQSSVHFSSTAWSNYKASKENYIGRIQEILDKQDAPPDASLND